MGVGGGGGGNNYYNNNSNNNYNQVTEKRLNIKISEEQGFF